MPCVVTYRIMLIMVQTEHTTVGVCLLCRRYVSYIRVRARVRVSQRKLLLATLLRFFEVHCCTYERQCIERGLLSSWLRNRPIYDSHRKRAGRALDFCYNFNIVIILIYNFNNFNFNKIIQQFVVLVVLILLLILFVVLYHTRNSVNDLSLATVVKSSRQLRSDVAFFLWSRARLRSSFEIQTPRHKL